jgi:phosphonate transport system substrate-binding protein
VLKAHFKKAFYLFPLIVLLFSFTPRDAFSAEAAFTPGKQPTLLIGLIPEMNVFMQMERFKVLAGYVSEKTGVQIRLTILSRYGNVLEKFKEERMDGAFLGSFTGALAISKLGLDPIVRPVNLDGEATYSGYIFVRKGSGIRRVEQMKGKKMAFVDRATTAGYIFPIAYLKRHGINNINTFFKEYYFTGSHDAAILAVLNKEADIGAAKHSIFNRVREQDPRIDKEILILAESPKVPSNGLCLRKDLDPILKKKLKETLLNIDKDKKGREVLAKFGALKFIETRASDYAPVFKLAQDAGIDMKTYHYRNR